MSQPAPISIPKGYQRLGAFPLDASSVFATLAELQTYASSNGTAYAGQVCAVIGTGKVYVIQSDKSLLELGAGSGAGQFQPNPEFTDDNVASVALTGTSEGDVTLPRTGDNYYRSGSLSDFHELFKVTNKWRYLFVLVSQEETSVQMQVDSLSDGNYPWQAVWPSGFTAAKAALPRQTGQPLAATATEGSSSYAARADHVHPAPTALQIGAAPLQGGKIPSQYLPSYVDDVIEYQTLSALQSDLAARESGKIYVVRESGKIYRWSGGSLFIEISNSLELQDLQLPDSLSPIEVRIPGFPHYSITKTGERNQKPFYSGFEYQTGYEVFWTGSNWKATAEYSGDGYEFEEITATGNTNFPWQATGWTNGGGVFRVGTYSASLAPVPLAVEASSGTGTKAAREDHVHPLPTPAQIGAATAVQGVKADTAVQRHAADATPVHTIRVLTQGEYDAVSPKDLNTIYFIKQ